MTKPKKEEKLYVTFDTCNNFLIMDERRILKKYPHVTNKEYKKYLFRFRVQYGCGVTPMGTVIYPWTKEKFKEFILDQEREWRNETPIKT